MSKDINDYNELNYTIGLIAGEGSFFITFVRDSRYEYGLWYGPKMAVSMGQKSEEMLKAQRDLYGLGTVNENSKGYSWILSARDDCHELKHLIDSYLDQHEDAEFTRTPKYQAYKSWCKALDLLEPDRKLTKEEVVLLAKLRDEINYIRAPSHITTEEIKEILDEE